MTQNELITFGEYQNITQQTDQNPNKAIDDLHFPLLGLFGEVGSLLSELKKKQRDTDSYVGYEASVIEEFGDVLWYFTNITTRVGLDLNILTQKVFRDISDWDSIDPTHLGTFADIESPREHVGPVSNNRFEAGVIALAGKVGRLLDDVSTRKLGNNRDIISAHLVEILRAIIQAAEDADISLATAVKNNISKITSRWPIERRYTGLFDNRFDADEQLPRKIEMEIAEKPFGGKLFVVQKCKGIKIGDRLTDNKTKQDDYRFHDVFHLAYAAILGWSPVIRALFKVKRKSDPEIDENEDGARAILIEEGVATLIFNHGIRLNNFESIRSLDYALLKSIKELVNGYEVQKCPLWQWEEAILEGFKVFRFLKKHRSGLVIADLESRKINIEPI